MPAFQYPNRSPEKRVRFGKEESRSTDEEKASAFAPAFSEPCGVSSDMVHRGSSNPNRVSSLHGKSARGDGSPLSRLSEADKTAPKVRHQKAGTLLGARFLVPVTGLEPVRGRPQGILSPWCLPFHHTGLWPALTVPPGTARCQGKAGGAQARSAAAGRTPL